MSDEIERLENENRRLEEEASTLRRAVDDMDARMSQTRGRLLLGLVLLIVVGIFISLFSLAYGYANKVFNPTNVPREYYAADTYMRKIGNDVRIAWVPFYNHEKYYSWAGGKRLGPFNIYSSNPNLNNIVDIFSGDTYYLWFNNLFSQNQFVNVKIMNEAVMLPADIASKMLIPAAAKYMILDRSRPDFSKENPFEFDRSLRHVMSTGFLDIYRLDYTPETIRPASCVVRAESFFDYLAVSQRFTDPVLAGIPFIYGGEVVGKEYGQLDMKDYEIPVPVNGGFEEWDLRQGFADWTTKQGPNSSDLSADGTDRVSGKNSLKVGNISAVEYDFKMVTGREIPVSEDEVYTFQAYLKYENANWTHIAVEGYLQFTGQWIQMALCPTIQSGTSGWKRNYCSFRIPAGITKMRINLGAGWRADPQKGFAVSWFDEVKLARIQESFFATLGAEKAGPTVKFEKISPEKYKVHITGAVTPFVLIFGESYNQRWSAVYPDGKRVAPVKLYSLENGFRMSRLGNYDLTIEYRPQTWFHQGLIIALAALLFSILYLIFRSRIRAAVGGVFERERGAGSSGTRQGPGTARKIVEFTVLRPARFLRRKIEEPRLR